MTPKRLVVVVVAALVAYFLLIGYFGIYLLGQSGVGLKVLGGAVLAFPLIGVWIVVAELRFGAATARLGASLDAEGVAPDDEPTRTASGRVERAAADALFEQRRDEVQAEPGDWRRWYRLAVAYDLAGDRRRARSAMRTAIELSAN